MALPASGSRSPRAISVSNGDRLIAAASSPERDHLLSLAFNSARDMMLLARVEPGPIFRILSVNRKYLETVRAAGFPVAEEDFVGRAFADLQKVLHYPAAAWALILERFATVVQTSQPAQYEEVTEAPQGTFYGDTTITPVFDEAGTCIMVLYASADVTGRKRAEIALKDSEAKFSQAFRASPGGMGISDFATRRFVEVNDGYCRLFGFKREEMIGRTPDELKMWADAAERDLVVEELLARAAVEEIEVAGRRKDGELIHCLLRAESVELGGRLHFVSSLYDITARKRAEVERARLEAQLRQAQKIEALGQLAGGIAHDFNNILAGIDAYTKLALLDAERPAQVRQHLAIIRNASVRASELVRQILTFSRKQPHEYRPVALPGVVQEAVKLLRSSLPRTIELAEHYDSATPMVLADPTQIHQVLLNLCTNSAHALENRTGRIAIELRPVTITPREQATGGPRAGRYARLTVSDTGRGMDEPTMARIFDPFFTTKPPGEGTGLGLAVVHGIVEDHDGRITVRSQPGRGATFDVLLPEIVAVNPAPPGNEQERPSGARPAPAS